nr:hypothetical protein [Tanacetum cinerariifolium]
MVVSMADGDDGGYCEEVVRVALHGVGDVVAWCWLQRWRQLECGDGGGCGGDFGGGGGAWGRVVWWI